MKCDPADDPASRAGRTPQGVRGLKCSFANISLDDRKSHPARGAWIEIKAIDLCCKWWDVAPRKGRVD